MEKSGNPVVFLAKKMWEFSEGRRKDVVTFFAMFVGANATDFVRPFIIAAVLNDIQLQGIHASNIRHLLLVTAAFPLMSVLFWALHGPARVIERRNAFHVRARYKKYLLEGTLGLPASWHADHHSGDTIDRINRGSDALFSFSENTFEVIQAVVMLVTSVIALMWFDITGGLVAFVAIVLTFGLVMRFDRVLDRQYDELYRADNGIAAKIFDILSNVVTVIVLRMEKLAIKETFAKMLHPFRLFGRNAVINEAKWFGVSMFGAAMKLLVLGSFLLTASRGSEVIAVGTIFLLYSYAERVENVFYSFANAYSGLVQKRAQVANAEELAAHFRPQPRGNRGVAPRWKTLMIAGLDFSYERGTESKQLDNVSLTVKRGDKIALVGASGSGKTTLLRVLRGLYEPDRIALKVNGKSESRGLAALRDTMALVPQEPEIFASTIRENITLGIDRDQAMLERYVSMARFAEVVARLPKGYSSSIFEKGVNLSGGEKQRLALARGLLASDDKTVLLLDEPTSSVDAKNEHEIYRGILEAFPDKAVISSIHRLHLLPMFDRIYFFRDGKISAHGTLKQVLKDSREFRELWKRQASMRKALAVRR